MTISEQPSATERPSRTSVEIRRARLDDLAEVIAIDGRVTGLAKPDYWQDVFDRFAERRPDSRYFLVAEASGGAAGGGRIVGYIVGEVRAWEFGSGPCGWVFAFSVSPDARLKGVGTCLFEAIANEFRAAGVSTMRTMVARDNALHMKFFRSEGMMAGPYIQLEKTLE